MLRFSGKAEPPVRQSVRHRRYKCRRLRTRISSPSIAGRNPAWRADALQGSAPEGCTRSTGERTVANCSMNCAVDLDRTVQIAVDPVQRRNDTLRPGRRLEGDLEVMRRFAGNRLGLIDHLFGEAGQLLHAFIDGDFSLFRFRCRFGFLHRYGCRFRLRRWLDGYRHGLRSCGFRLCDGCCFKHGFGLRRLRPLHSRKELPLPQPVRRLAELRPE